MISAFTNSITGDYYVQREFKEYRTRCYFISFYDLCCLTSDTHFKISAKLVSNFLIRYILELLFLLKIFLAF